MTGVNYSLSSASAQRGLDAVARRSWVPGKQSTVFLQLQSNGTGQVIYGLVVSFDPTALGRSVDATLFRLTKSAFAQYAATRRRCDYWTMPQF